MRTFTLPEELLPKEQGQYRFESYNRLARHVSDIKCNLL